MSDTGTVSSWRRVPEPLWWAAIPVLAGFVLGWPVIETRDDGTCLYLDYADLVLGPLALLLVAVGIVLHLRRTPGQRCGTQLLLSLVVLLGGLGAYHLLTGFGYLVGAVCG